MRKHNVIFNQTIPHTIVTVAEVDSCTARVALKDPESGGEKKKKAFQWEELQAFILPGSRGEKRYKSRMSHEQ